MSPWTIYFVSDVAANASLPSLTIYQAAKKLDEWGMTI